ncbi:MAG: DUF2802 domain-containing protein [Pseudomonadota bacterium]
MLETLTFTGRELLVAVILATLVYLLEAWILGRWRDARRQARQQGRLDEIQEDIAALKTRVEKLEQRPVPDGGLDEQKSLHAEAARMARTGASAEELANQLGISRTEADLIIALHKSEP